MIIRRIIGNKLRILYYGEIKFHCKMNEEIPVAIWWWLQGFLVKCVMLPEVVQGKPQGCRHFSIIKWKS